jgi:hypothetical protein
MEGIFFMLFLFDILFFSSIIQLEVKKWFFSFAYFQICISNLMEINVMFILKKIWLLIPVVILGFYLSSCGGSSVNSVDGTNNPSASNTRFTSAKITGFSKGNAQVQIGDSNIVQKIDNQKIDNSFTSVLKLKEYFVDNYDEARFFVFDKDERFFETDDLLELGQSYTLLVEIVLDGHIVLSGSQRFVMSDELFVIAELAIQEYTFTVDLDGLVSVVYGEVDVPVDSGMFVAHLNREYILTFESGDKARFSTGYASSYNFLEFDTIRLVPVSILGEAFEDSEFYSYESALNGFSLLYDSEIDLLEGETLSFYFVADQDAYLSISRSGSDEENPGVYVESQLVEDGYKVIAGDEVVVEYTNSDDLNAFIGLTEAEYIFSAYALLETGATNVHTPNLPAGLYHISVNGINNEDTTTTINGIEYDDDGDETFFGEDVLLELDANFTVSVQQLDDEDHAYQYILNIELIEPEEI